MPPEEITYHCANCDFESTDLDDFDGDEDSFLCRDCYSALYTHCSECGGRVESSSITCFDGNDYCPSCFDDVVTTCDMCGDRHYRSDIIEDDNGDYVCRGCHQKVEFHPSTTFALNPSKRFVGVEIELIIPYATSASDMTPILGGHGKFKHDGSVGSLSSQGESGEGMEFTIYPTNGDKLLERISTICRIFAENKCFVNKTCGLHIHLDMRNTSSEERRNVFEWWRTLQPIFLACVPESRHRNNFCYKLSATQDYLTNERYCAFNTTAFKKFGTYEIRLHQGSLNPSKILGWIQLHLAFFDTFTQITASSERLAKVHKMLPREQLIFLFQQCKLPLYLRKYIVERIRKYSKPFVTDLQIKPSTKEITLYV